MKKRYDYNIWKENSTEKFQATCELIEKAHPELKKEELKTKSDTLFRELGTDTTSAIRMFLTQAVANNGFPFELKKKTVNPYVTLTEDEVLKKLEASRQHAAEGMVRDADDVISDMRQKYGI